eukprot:scaffold67896_cov20-Tisochrysis_lutea.AAC.2
MQGCSVKGCWDVGNAHESLNVLYLQQTCLPACLPAGFEHGCSSWTRGCREKTGCPLSGCDRALARIFKGSLQGYQKVVGQNAGPLRMGVQDPRMLILTGWDRLAQKMPPSGLT